MAGKVDDDLVLTRLEMQPLKHTVEFVHLPGEVPIHVDRGIVGFDRDPKVRLVPGIGRAEVGIAGRYRYWADASTGPSVTAAARTANGKHL